MLKAIGETKVGGLTTLMTDESYNPYVVLKCPICGHDCCHITNVHRNDKLYGWGKYGSVTIEIRCEIDNHKWFVVLNDHKGNVFVETVIPPQVYNDTEA